MEKDIKMVNFTASNETNKMRTILAVAGMSAMALASCSDKANEAEETVQTEIETPERGISVEVARKEQFCEDIVSNGKVVPMRSADLYWQSQGLITRVTVGNGQMVTAGQVIATLDTFKLRNAMLSARASMENARLSMTDVLIGQGYDPACDTIPARLREIAEVKSGFMAAKVAYSNAKNDLENAVVRAPFGGIVANMEAKEANMAVTSKPICRITDRNQMRVEFNIIESELGLVSRGTAVHVEAYALPGKKFAGRIEEINPIVDASGMTTARASVEAGSELYEGMNVRVWIDKGVGEYVSVPKKSVVRRSDRTVVFTIEKGEAIWNYVTVVAESNERMAIADGVKAGDTVAVEGANDLAHKSRVKY